MARNTEDNKNIHTLYPIDAFGIQKVSLSGIRVERLEDRIRPLVPFPHKHDFFQVMIMTKGSGHHQIDFINYAVLPGQIYLMKPGQIHSWDLHRDAKGILIEFSYQSLNSLQKSTKIVDDFSYSPDMLVVSDKKDFKEIVELSEIMLNESRLKREMHDLSLQGYLTAFLITVIRLYQRNLKQEKTLSIIERFRNILEVHFKEAHAVDFYAKELNTSPKALTMQLSRAIGRPPRQLIQERILLEAKRYLAFSDLSIAEIGYELGFDDANYFTRFFRTHEKKTPARFRKDSQKIHHDNCGH